MMMVIMTQIMSSPGEPGQWSVLTPASQLTIISAESHQVRQETRHYGHLTPGVITCHHMSRNVTDEVESLTIGLISRLSPRQLAALC